MYTGRLIAEMIIWLEIGNKININYLLDAHDISTPVLCIIVL